MPARIAMFMLVRAKQKGQDRARVREGLDDLTCQAPKTRQPAAVLGLPLGSLWGLDKKVWVGFRVCGLELAKADQMVVFC